MEFDFHIRGLGGESHISKWDAAAIKKLSPEDLENLTSVITLLGKKSALAQGLAAPITDIWRLKSTDQRLYVYAVRHSSGTAVLGCIKVGSKKLFVRTESNSLCELDAQSVLDFYVHESCQRQGMGKRLFEHMLAAEQMQPAGMAYDRPSPKLLAFLEKHYGLSRYVPQNNNFVIFNQFYEVQPTAPMARGRLPGMAMRPHARGEKAPVPKQSNVSPSVTLLQSPSHQIPAFHHQPHQFSAQLAPPSQQHQQQPQQQQQQYAYQPQASTPSQQQSYAGSYQEQQPQPPQHQVSFHPQEPAYGSPQSPMVGNAAPAYVGTGMRTNLIEPFSYLPSASRGTQQPRPGMESSLSSPSLQKVPSFGQRWGQSNGLILPVGSSQSIGYHGPVLGESSPSSQHVGATQGMQPQPSQRQRQPGEDSLDDFRVEAASQQLHHQQQQLTPPYKHPLSGGSSGGAHPYTPKPPWGTDEGMQSSPGIAGYQQGTPRGASTGGAAQHSASPYGGSEGGAVYGSAAVGRQPRVPPGSGGTGASPVGPGGPAARQAGLAQRSGAGAAGCMVW